MSHAAMLERLIADQEDDWIEVAAPASNQPAPAGSPVLAAIASAQERIARGELASASIEDSSLSEVDELDDAAIRAFFNAAD